MREEVILRAIEGDLFGNEYLFSEKMSGMIGRTSNCILCIPSSIDPRISRCHCKFDVDPPNITITDLESRNGTFVNGEQLAPLDRNGNPRVYTLRNGDKLRVGKTIFIVDIKTDTPLMESIPETEQTKIVAIKHKTPSVSSKIVQGERGGTSGKAHIQPKKSIAVHNDFLGHASQLGSKKINNNEGDQAKIKTISGLKAPQTQEPAKQLKPPTASTPRIKLQLPNKINDPAKPLVAKMVEKQPVTPKPIVAKLVGKQPPETKIIETKPMVARLVGKQPVEPKPMVAKLVGKKPGATKPMVAKLVGKQPVTPKPMVAKLVGKQPVTPKPMVAKLVEKQPSKTKLIAPRLAKKQPATSQMLAIDPSRNLANKRDEAKAKIAARNKSDQTKTSKSLNLQTENTPLTNIVIPGGAKKSQPRRKVKIVIKGMPDPSDIPTSTQAPIEQTKIISTYKTINDKK